MIDRIIAYFSPEWGARRQAARALVEHFGSYRGARYEPVDSDIGPLPGASPDAHTETAEARRRMVDRARELERNNVLAETVLTASVNNVVGRGFELQMLSKSHAWNEEIEGRWREIRDNLDSRGLLTFRDILAAVLRSYLRDGDVGAIKRDDGRLRLTESDEIATVTGGALFDPGKVDGIDLDGDGRPTAYHVIRNPRSVFTADRRTAGGSIRIPANRMIFLARRQRIGQTRGISAFSTTSWIFDQIRGQIDAVTAAARMAACFGLIIKREARFGAAPPGKQRKLNFRPGGVFEVFPGESVDQIKPEQPHTNLGEFLRLLTRFVALPFGLPLEVALNDFSQTNYSNARAANLNAWHGWRLLQDLLRKFCGEVFQWQIPAIAASMRLTRQPRGAFEHKWQAPGWQWTDREKEVQADLAAVDAGFDTLTDVCARMGRDFEEVLRKRAEETALAKAVGVQLAHSVLTREPLAQTEPESEPELEADPEAEPGEKPETESETNPEEEEDK